MKYIVLDPTDGPVKTGFDLAPRLESLAGLTAGLIDNGKKNSDTLLNKIAALLKERYGLASVIYLKKPSASHGITEDQARDLARKTRFVVAGIGD
jgi:hypothetical protein